MLGIMASLAWDADGDPTTTVLNPSTLASGVDSDVAANELPEGTGSGTMPPPGPSLASRWRARMFRRPARMPREAVIYPLRGP